MSEISYHILSKENRCWSAKFSPDGLWLACGFPQNIQIWQISNWECIHFLPGNINERENIAFSRDGMLLASIHEAHTITIWTIPTFKIAKTLTTGQFYGESLRFSPDGQLLASGGTQGIRFWRTDTWEFVHEIRQPETIKSIAFSPDGQLVASASEDNKIKLWYVTTGECVQVLSGSWGEIFALEFSPDGLWLASGSSDEVVRLWSVPTWKLTHTFWGPTFMVSSIAFSSNGEWLAAGSYDANTYVWHVATGNLMHILSANSTIFRTVTFSPDDKWLVCGGGGVILYQFDKLKDQVGIEGSPLPRWLSRVEGRFNTFPVDGHTASELHRIVLKLERIRYDVIGEIKFNPGVKKWFQKNMQDNPVILYIERIPCASCDSVVKQFLKWIAMELGITAKIILDWTTKSTYYKGSPSDPGPRKYEVCNVGGDQYIIVISQHVELERVPFSQISLPTNSYNRSGMF